MRAKQDGAGAKRRELVLEQTRSGKRVSAFCAERDLRTWQFYEWKKRLRDADAVKFVEVAVPPATEIAQQSSQQGSAVEVRLRSGHSVVVELGFDASHLRALLAVLESEA
jgi:hypothetical protein